MNRHESQRGYFADELYEQMKNKEDIFLVVGDLGYKMFDKHFEEFPDRCINVGASEQAGVGICVGLALKGKRPFFYTITSFMLRAAETISLYLDHEQIPVQLVGSGRDQDYEHDGYSHDAGPAQRFLASMDINQLYPETKEQVPEMVIRMIDATKPGFISLKRG